MSSEADALTNKSMGTTAGKREEMRHQKEQENTKEKR